MLFHFSCQPGWPGWKYSQSQTTLSDFFCKDPTNHETGTLSGNKSKISHCFTWTFPGDTSQHTRLRLADLGSYVGFRFLNVHICATSCLEFQRDHVTNCWYLVHRHFVDPSDWFHFLFLSSYQCVTPEKKEQTVSRHREDFGETTETSLLWQKYQFCSKKQTISARNLSNPLWYMSVDLFRRTKARHKLLTHLSSDWTQVYPRGCCSRQTWFENCLLASSHEGVGQRTTSTFQWTSAKALAFCKGPMSRSRKMNGSIFHTTPVQRVSVKAKVKRFTFQMVSWSFLKPSWKAKSNLPKNATVMTFNSFYGEISLRSNFVSALVKRLVVFLPLGFARMNGQARFLIPDTIWAGWESKQDHRLLKTSRSLGDM